MLLVLDEAAAHAELDAGTLACPGAACPGRLRPWAYGRERVITHRGGRRVRLRPRRARCSTCRRSHILLPAWCAPRRGYSLELIAEALARKLAGAGHRSVAAELDVPAGTVRDWLRRVGSRAEALRCAAVEHCVALDPELLPARPAGSPLGDALDALAAAVHAARQRHGHPRRMVVPLLGTLGLARHLAPARGG